MVKRCVTFIVVVLAWSAKWSMAQAPQPIIRNPNNPPLFQRFAAPPSATLQFLLSDGGRRALRRARTPAAITILKALGEDVTAQLPSAPSIPPEEPIIPSNSEPAVLMPMPAPPAVVQSPQILVSGCGINGTVFNLEPALNAAPQFTESVDFFYNAIGVGEDLVAEGADDLGLGGTAYYVHTAPAGCAPAFEGVLPELTGLSGESDSGAGEPVVVADPVHQNLYMADIRFGSNGSGGTTAIGLFRSARANLLNAANCPAGIHTTLQANTCWPTRRLIDPLPDPMGQYTQDSPGLAADNGAAHAGAGDVYVTGTEFDFNGGISRIWLVACAPNLTVCSSPVMISADDTAAQFSYVKVRPDGGITITYVQSPPNSDAIDIKYVACRPQQAPVTPSCAPPVLVTHETQPLFRSLIAEPFQVTTFPKHATRVDGGVTQTFVVWDRCKVKPSRSDFCPDADLQMKYTANNGLTWAGPINVANGTGDQFFPAVAADSSRRTVNISYYNNGVDSKFHHRLIVSLRQILPGKTTPTAPFSVTSTPNDTSTVVLFGGGFAGDYIGLAARGNGTAGGSRIYAGYSYNLRQGNYGGVLVPQADNYLNRLTY